MNSRGTHHPTPFAKSWQADPLLVQAWFARGAMCRLMDDQEGAPATSRPSDPNHELSTAERSRRPPGRHPSRGRRRHTASGRTTTTIFGSTVERKSENRVSEWKTRSSDQSRRGGDSNPRYAFAHTGFRNQLDQPLRHLSNRGFRERRPASIAGPVRIFTYRTAGLPYRASAIGAVGFPASRRISARFGRPIFQSTPSEQGCKKPLGSRLAARPTRGGHPMNPSTAFGQRIQGADPEESEAYRLTPQKSRSSDVRRDAWVSRQGGRRRVLGNSARSSFLP